MKPIDQLKNLLFIDIETASWVKDYADLPERLHPLWDKKGKRLEPDMEASDSFFKWAPIFAEYGKIITIGVGYFVEEGEELMFRVKSIQHEDEKAILEEFKQMVDKKTKRKLVAHNGLEFDYPFIGRRMLINGMTLPKSLNFMGMRSWEIKHLDTLHMWKFGEYRHYTSLETLAALFDIPSSKTDLDGSKVNEAYHIDQRLDDIANYCIQDVIVTARVYLKLTSLPNLPEENIVYVE